MTTSLPSKPNLERLRNEAKSVLKAHKKGDASSCAVLKNLHQFKDKPDRDVLSAEVSLAEVQFALAIVYGFENWRELKKHVTHLQGGTAIDTGGVGYSALSLKSNHFADDSYSMTMQAAATLLGVEADHDTVYALSTNGFSPALRVDEPCDDSWRMQNKDRAKGTVAASLGLTATRLPNAHEISVLPEKPQSDEGKAEYICEFYRKPYVPLIRNAMKNGEVIVVSGEWDPKDAFWCEWGIVLDAHDDGTIIGAASNGKKDCRFVHTEGWRLRKTGERLPQDEANVVMLRNAIKRIHSETPFVPRWDDHRETVFGLDAMDAWIERMSGKFFGNATAICTCEGARTLARYLRGQRDTLANDTARHTDAVASAYEGIVEALSPAIEQELFRKWHTDDDIASQKDYADSVLRSIKDKMARAVDEIEKALAAME